VNLGCVSVGQPTFYSGDRGSSFFLLPPLLDTLRELTRTRQAA